MDLLMILVTLGTQDKSFKRLLETIEELIKLKVITEEVIVQAGLTTYHSEYMQIFDFMSADQFEKLLKQASVVITHGGVGTIITALKYDKVVIAAPRLKAYSEHTNDHQVEIIKKLSQDGCILPLWQMNKLENLLTEAKNFKAMPFNSNTTNIITLINDYIKTNS